MKKFLIPFSLFLFFFGVVRLVSAQNWVDPNIKNSGDARDTARDSGELNMEAYNQKNLDESFVSLGCSLGGIGCTGKTEDQQSYINRSVLGMSVKGVALVYANPPAGTAPFVLDALARAGFVDKAYAQGVGYSALSPLIPIWRVFRNITYILMIIVLVVLGFMIMFRRAIDPQTVITVQSALPRVIMTLILITFSYAIAGFVIDMMYVLILLIVSIFGQMGIFDASQISRVQQEFIGGGFWALIKNVFSTLPFSEVGKDILPGVGAGLLIRFIPSLAVGVINPAIGYLLFGLLSGALQPPGSDVGGMLFAPFSPILIVIMMFVFIFAFFRVLFMLFSAYIQIIINILFAPFMLVADVIPGGQGFTNWITNLIGHVLVFPTTVAMILIGHAIVRNAEHLWTPPLMPQFGGRFIQSLIGVSIIILIPSIVKQVQELFKASAPIGVTPGTIASPVTKPVLEAQQYWYMMTGGHLLGEVKKAGQASREAVRERSLEPFRRTFGGD